MSYHLSASPTQTGHLLPNKEKSEQARGIDYYTDIVKEGNVFFLWFFTTQLFSNINRKKWERPEPSWSRSNPMYTLSRNSAVQGTTDQGWQGTTSNARTQEAARRMARERLACTTEWKLSNIHQSEDWSLRVAKAHIRLEWEMSSWDHGRFWKLGAPEGLAGGGKSLGKQVPAGIWP